MIALFSQHEFALKATQGGARTRLYTAKQMADVSLNAQRARRGRDQVAHEKELMALRRTQVLTLARRSLTV